MADGFAFFQCHVAMGREKRCEIPGDGGIRGVRQAEFLESRLAGRRFCIESDAGKEAFDDQFFDFLPGNGSLQAAADQSRPRTGERQRPLLGRVIAEQDFFDLAATADEHAPLAGFELAIPFQFPFDVMGQHRSKLSPPRIRWLPTATRWN